MMRNAKCRCNCCGQVQAANALEMALTEELAMTPAMNATARFALVTLAGRTEAPALPIVRRLMTELLRDA